MSNSVVSQDIPQQRELLVELLREIRVESGLRQAEVAKKLGFPQSFVSKYEAGERRLDIIELRAVCRALDISLEEFTAKFEARVRERHV